MKPDSAGAYTCNTQQCVVKKQHLRQKQAPSELLIASTEIPLEISCGKITLNPSIDIRLKDILNQLTFKAAAVLACLENAKTLLTPLYGSLT